MSLKERLEAQKAKLSHVSEIRVKKADGTIQVEEMLNTGESSIKSTSMPQNEFGFVVDETPDLQVAEVTDRLFVGSQDAAAEKTLLRSNGITHVLNVGVGIQCFFADTFKYKVVEILDVPEEDLASKLDVCVGFICEAIAENDSNRVFVHCNAGVSRSCAVVIAFLLAEGLADDYDAALAIVKRRRKRAKPNRGFERQLRLIK